jgi:hypothetical protein
MKRNAQHQLVVFDDPASRRDQREIEKVGLSLLDQALSFLTGDWRETPLAYGLGAVSVTSDDGIDVDLSHRGKISDVRHQTSDARGGYPADFGPSFAVEAFELDVGVVGEFHSPGDGVVTGDFGDLAMHLETNPAIGRVAGRLSSKLDQMTGLAGVHLHDETDVEAEWHHVLRNVGPQAGAGVFVELTGPFHDPAKIESEANVFNVRGALIPEAGTETLPFDRQQPMPLQITEGTEVA